jgi:NAD(P)H-nitrite reductase large subunit
MSALNYFGVPIISVGLTTLGSAEGYESLVFSDEKAGVYKKIVLKGGIIVGMSFVGDVEAAGIVFNLMKREVNVEGFKQRIPSSSFSLASLPDDLRKKIIGA